MGGFRGGHSGRGGGFHGGFRLGRSSGGGFFRGRGGSGSSSGGFGYRHHYHRHSEFDGSVSFAGKSYPIYIPFKFFATISIIFLFVGLGLFFYLATPYKANATIENVTIHSQEGYEEYAFTYVYDNKTYHCTGEDKLAYNGEALVNVGDVYKVYIHFFDDSWFEFEDNTLGGIMALVGCILASAFSLMAGAAFGSSSRKRDYNMSSGYYETPESIEGYDEYSGYTMNTGDSDISSGDIYGDNIGGFEYQGDRSHETNYGSKSSKDDDSNFRLKL